MRIVYKFPRSNSSFLNTLLERVISVNAKALQLDGLPAHEIETVLMTYKLTR